MRLRPRFMMVISPICFVVWFQRPSDTNEGRLFAGGGASGLTPALRVGAIVPDRRGQRQDVNLSSRFQGEQAPG